MEDSRLLKWNRELEGTDRARKPNKRSGDGVRASGALPLNRTKNVEIPKGEQFTSSVPLGHLNVISYFILRNFKYVTITHTEKSASIFYY